MLPPLILPMESYVSEIPVIFFIYKVFKNFGCVGSLLLHVGFPLVAASGGYSSLWCGLLMRWLLLLRSTGSRRTGFSSCGAWAQ